MTNWLDLLPANERAKIRTRMRSPEEYEKLRERVKGPEDLEREMDFNESMAELKFTMETEPKVKESLKKQVENDLKEQGLENVLENTEELSEELKEALDVGKFEVAVENNPETDIDQLMIIPEGNVSDKVPVNVTFSEQYSSHLSREDVVAIEVQVNSELVGYLDVPEGLTQAEVEMVVLSEGMIKEYLNDMEVENIEYHPASSINIVTK